MNIRKGLVGAFSLANTIAAVADFLQPIAPMADIVAAISFFSLLIGLAAYFILKSKISLINHDLVHSTLWLLGFTFVSSIALSVLQRNVSAEETGVLAKGIPPIAKLQQALGILVDDIAAIEKNTRSINMKINTLKKETSTDPRKELANRGLPWTEDRYLETILHCDYQNMNLYYHGGMKINFYKGTHQNVFIRLVHDTPESCRLQTFKWLINRKLIDPQKTIYIYYGIKDGQGDIPRSWANTFPIDQEKFENLFVESFKRTNKKLFPFYIMESSLLALATIEQDVNLVDYLLKWGGCNQPMRLEVAYGRFKNNLYSSFSIAMKSGGKINSLFRKTCH